MRRRRVRIGLRRPRRGRSPRCREERRDLGRVPPPTDPKRPSHRTGRRRPRRRQVGRLQATLLVEPIGEGGMGAVWMAEQTEPVRRLVAVKLIKPGMDTAAGDGPLRGRAPGPGPDGPSQHRQGARCRHHRRPALLRHGAGEGHPDHRPIATPTGSRRGAAGIVHAGLPGDPARASKGVIHRDIKPSNVLVALYDGKPVPKVIDFGVAKATGQRLTENTLFTELRRDRRHAGIHEPGAGRVRRLDIDTRRTSTRWACSSTNC